MRYALLFAMCLFMPFAAAQEDAQKVDLAVGYPSTTMVYFRADTTEYLEALNPEEIFAGLEQDNMGIPDLGKIAKERLELPLTDEQIKALATGVEGVSAGLLDVGVSGPKYQFVIQHKDLSDLVGALKQANKDGAITVPEIGDYYGTPIYEIYLPLAPVSDEQPNPFGAGNGPFDEWATEQDFWAAVVNDKHLIIANNENAVKDAVDFLSFPDDPIDTLLGNRRYEEAIGDFDAPQSVVFVNVQSVINAMERLAGDQGGGGMIAMIMQNIFDSNGEEGRFFFDLIQYEQFKSFAAGLWIDEESLTLRMDANLVFHNPPAWFDTLRIEPKEMPLTQFIPSDSMIAITDCVADANGLYEKAKDFFVTRARNAGQDKLADMWQQFEDEVAVGGSTLEDTLSQFGIGQALVILPSGNEPDILSGTPVHVAGILGVNDCAEAEEFFYEHILASGLGEIFRKSEGGLAPVTLVNGIEIHHTSDATWGFAFMPGEGDTGAFLVGNTEAVTRIIRAKSDNSNLHSLSSWQEARGLLWETGSLHMYMNFGSVIGAGLGSVFRVQQFWWGGEEEDDLFDRDDTEKDDDPTPFLADFFSSTVVVGSSRSAESSIHVRVAAAGWPDRDRLRGMALHFRDVQRNLLARDDFVRVRDAARDHFALQGTPAKTVSELTAAGYIADADWAKDPFGTEDENGRDYALADVPEDVDIRQPILCAYQAQPGLRGNHLAVLWNTHIVELTPEQLTNALTLARGGKPLPTDGDWYKDALKPLYKDAAPSSGRGFDVWEDPIEVAEVDIIDEDGDESTVEVDPDEIMEDTEEILDQQEVESGKSSD